MLQDASPNATSKIKNACFILYKFLYLLFEKSVQSYEKKSIYAKKKHFMLYLNIRAREKIKIFNNFNIVWHDF